MLAVLMRRLAAMPLVLLAASLFVFALPTLTGVDLARATLQARIAEPDPDPQTLQNIRNELALDRPFVVHSTVPLSSSLRGAILAMPTAAANLWGQLS